MLTQLIRHCEERPEKYTEEAKEAPQTLVMIDEFPRLGKLEIIQSGLSTLRSRKVNFMLAAQSLPQLDQIYGEAGRERICGDCEYKLLLRASDTKTQRYFADLVGTDLRWQLGITCQLNMDGEVSGYSEHLNQLRDYIIQPSDLGYLNRVLLLTPKGRFLVNKLPPDNELDGHLIYAQKSQRWCHSLGLANLDDPMMPLPELRMNYGSVMTGHEERYWNARAKVEAAAQKVDSGIDYDRGLATLLRTYIPDFNLSEDASEEQKKDGLNRVEVLLETLSGNSTAWESK